jgi:ubiquinone/menaquinone biosynthesis C-methylase UbiE
METKPITRSPGDVCPCTPWTTMMLDNVVRSLFQSPKRMLGGLVRPGMTVIDLGCGPGFFTLAMAEMTAPDGTVVAVDVQEEMLALVKEKAAKKGLSSRITLHRCAPDEIGLGDLKADFALSFYMVHEVPDSDAFFREVAGLLKPGGRYFIVEPVFHVSEEAFDNTLDRARRAGFLLEQRPRLMLSRAALLSRDHLSGVPA